MSDIALVDDAIRVVVTPSQASYFAGEPFSVTITFTNTRTQDLPTSRSASLSAPNRHKRTAHSISSVPLARPPTSPGNPRTAVPALSIRSADVNDVYTRKGLIGRKSLPTGTDDLPDSMDPMRKRVLTKSLSISIMSSELEGLSQDSLKSMPSINSLRVTESAYSSPTSPRISSPLARSNSLPIAPSHPHARKQSVLDGQLQPSDLRQPVPQAQVQTPIQPPFSPSASTSTSSFSLSLDPISESSSSPVPPATPFAPSPVPDSALPHIRTQLASPVKETPINTNGSVDVSIRVNGGHTRKHAQLGIGPPPRRPPQLGNGAPPVSHSPRNAFSSSFSPPNTELILYSYAQLVGTLSISPVPGAAATPEQTQTLSHLRSSLLKRKGVGGGSMDITSSMSYQAYSVSSSMQRGTHGRSSSLSGGLFSLLSPTALLPSSPSLQPWTPSHRTRAASVFSLFSNVDNEGPVGLGLGVGIAEEETDADLPLPTFEVQPSLLAVDLSLAPGESRTFTYTVVLPEDLPPTHRGRVLKLSYQFILGICRSPSSLPSGGLGPTGANSSSRVMKVPIRMYNNVVVGRPPAPYDLLWPCRTRRAQFPVKVIEEPVGAAKKGDRAPQQAVSRVGTLEDLQAYARRLLASCPAARAVGVPLDLPVDLEREREREEAGGLAGCRQAVEILTRNPKKASYDVNKDGVKVAVLTFTKSAYRLGETVLGVVELNERSSRARVLKLSAMLEAHESLPGAISMPGSSRQTRRVHAEHHSSFVVSTLRTTFSLDIPPDGSPAFQVDVGGDTLKQPGGLEWKVRLCLLVAVAAPTARQSADGMRLKHLVRDGSRGEWGASWRAAANIAPLERPDARVHANPFGAPEQAPGSRAGGVSWISYIAASLLGPANEGYHDGDELAEEGEDAGEDDEGAEEDWRAVAAEMVECEVPIRVWPGNTAFKATEVVFDV